MYMYIKTHIETFYMCFNVHVHVLQSTDFPGKVSLLICSEVWLNFTSSTFAQLNKDRQ